MHAYTHACIHIHTHIDVHTYMYIYTCMFYGGRRVCGCVCHRAEELGCLGLLRALLGRCLRALLGRCLRIRAVREGLLGAGALVGLLVVLVEGLELGIEGDQRLVGPLVLGEGIVDLLDEHIGLGRRKWEGENRLWKRPENGYI